MAALIAAAQAQGEPGSALLAAAETLLLATRHQPLPLAEPRRLARAALRTLERQAGGDPPGLPEVDWTLLVSLLSALYLVAADGQDLVAAPAAGAWLGRPPGARLLDLFSAWLEGSSAAGQKRRRRPEERRTSGLAPEAGACASLLAGWPAGRPVDAAGLVAALVGGDVAAKAAQALATLACFGVLAPVAGEAGTYAITGMGASLLAGRPPDLPARPTVPWHLAGDLTVELPGTADLELVFDLEAFAGCLARLERYVLSPRSVAHGVARGLSAERMLCTLEEGTADALPAETGELIRLWAAQAAEVQVFAGLVLETHSPDTLRLLFRECSIRRHLTRLLSPRHALVRPGGEAALARLLARRGFAGPLAGAAARRPGGRDADAPWVAAAAVYQALSERLDLPLLLPPETLAAARDGLRPHEQQLVAEATRRALAALAPPETVPAPPRHAPLPGGPRDEAALLAEIEWAIAGERPLRIWYDTAGRGAPAARVVEPLLLDRRGLHTYLVAHCRERGGERLFRLDRIRALERQGEGQCR